MVTTHEPEPNETAQYWLDEIKAARKREETYRKRGEEIQAIYEAGKDQSDTDRAVPFNILYSNTETLQPALFSAIPRPVIDRRFKDDDPIGKLVAQAGKRMLEALMDTNREGYEPFVEAMENCTLDTLLPGRGAIQVKYDATFANPTEDGEGAPTEPTDETGDYVASELVCVESVVWNRVYYGYAKKWHQVPWLAYEFFLTKAEVAKILDDEEMAGKLTYTPERGTRDDEGHKPEREEQYGKRKTACVYQIWDKAGGKVLRYVSPTYTEEILKVEDDPLGLTGFFNQPRPLQFIKKSSSLVPTAPYDMYRTQAQELNRITQRINKIVEAVKARGAYDAQLGNLLKEIMKEDDNALVPADVGASMATEKGFQNSIWMIPIDVIVSVLTQLYQAREACKSVIYEITGISDILRGSSQASETATAQTIKNQWGTLRLKRMQREVARYARDVLRMMLDMAASKLSEETWAAMTALPFVTTQQRKILDMQAQAFTQMMQPVPEELQSELAKPLWGDILKILKDDLQRSYRVDIETNSTVQPEAAEDQEGLAKLMNVINQALAGLTPLVQSGTLPFPAAQQMLLFIARRFPGGSEMEDYIKAMQPPPPPKEDPTQQVEAMKEQAMQEVEMTKQKGQMDLTMKAMQKEMEQKKREMELDMREMELANEKQQLELQKQAAQEALNMQAARANEELDTKRKVTDLENRQYKTENVVNKKADTALGQGVAGMKALVQQLAEMVATQSAENQRMLAEITTAMTKPRIRQAIRGKDGRIEKVEEKVA